MQLPAGTKSFLRNVANNEMVFNYTEVAFKGGKKKTDKVLYFYNVTHCLKITQHQAFMATQKSSDHEEAGNKLVALAEGANIAYGNTAMIRSPSEDIDIIVFYTS